MSKALVVIDMQNDFITGSLGSDYAKNVVLPNVIKKISDKKYDHIYFTKDSHGKDYLKTLEGKKLPVEHCLIDSNGWQLAPEIIDCANRVFDPNDLRLSLITIKKSTFASMRLVEALNIINDTKGLKEIEICGLCTDICVVSNALLLRAFFPNIKITCDSSCCGGTSKEAHDAALLVMKSCQIEVI